MIIAITPPNSKVIFFKPVLRKVSVKCSASVFDKAFLALQALNWLILSF